MLMKKLFFLLSLSFIGLSNISGQVNLDSGYVAKYYFNGNANDESGNGYNAIPKGATLTSDRFGRANKAYYFDGIADTIDAGILPVFQTNIFSVSVWFLEQNTTGASTILGTFEHCGNPGGFTLTYYPVSQYLQLAGQSSPSGLNNVVLNNGNWNHITITFDGAFASIFLNGVLQNAVASNYIPNSNNFYIGNSVALCSNDSTSFLGKIDDIRIYNRALNGQEVVALYNEGLCYQTIPVTDTLFINANITGFAPITYGSTIKIYPNPTNDHVIIDAGDIADWNGYELQITNSIGQTMFQSLITQQLFFLDLSTWSGMGIYFVHIIDGLGNTIDIRKIVLQ